MTIKVAEQKADKQRKSPTYKLSVEQLTTQVLTLSPSELRAMKKSIEEELGKREKELEAQLKEVRGEGGI